MVEIEYKPVKKIILYEILFYEYDNFIDMVIKFTHGQIVLKWCNGVLFTSEMMPYTPDTIADRIDGTIHWNFVEFAYMPKYNPTVMSDNGIIITVVDVSTNSAINDVTTWLKRQPQWKVPQLETT